MEEKANNAWNEIYLWMIAAPYECQIIKNSLDLIRNDIWLAFFLM